MPYTKVSHKNQSSIYEVSDEDIEFINTFYSPVVTHKSIPSSDEMRTLQRKMRSYAQTAGTDLRDIRENVENAMEKYRKNIKLRNQEEVRISVLDYEIIIPNNLKKYVDKHVLKDKDYDVYLDNEKTEIVISWEKTVPVSK